MVPSPNQPGLYTLWVYVNSPSDISSSTPQLHSIRLHVPRRFYVNQRVPKAQESGVFYRKVSSMTTTLTDTGQPSSIASLSNYTLPRSHPVYHLYEYTVPEDVYASHAADIAGDLARVEVEGVYELRVPPLFRLLAKLGCLCAVAKSARTQTMASEERIFQLDQLEFRSLAQHTYLGRREGEESEDCRLRKMFLFYYADPGQVVMPRREALRQMYFLVVPWVQRAYVCVVDTARVNKLPANLDQLYSRAHSTSKSSKNLPSNITFEIRVETDPATARRTVQRWITSASQERGRGVTEKENSPPSNDSAPIVILLHSSATNSSISFTPTSPDAPWPIGEAMVNRRRAPQLTALAEMPVVALGGTLDDEKNAGEELEDAYSVLRWQHTIVKRAIKFYLQVGFHSSLIHYIFVPKVFF